MLEFLQRGLLYTCSSLFDFRSRYILDWDGLTIFFCSFAPFDSLYLYLLSFFLTRPLCKFIWDFWFLIRFLDFGVRFHFDDDVCLFRLFDLTFLRFGVG